MIPDRALGAEAAARYSPMPAHAGITPGRAATCVRRGRRWQISWGGRSAAVEHCVGMFHLLVLLGNPGAEIPAADLVAGVAGLARTATGAVSGQPMVDQVAVQQYRDRVSSLRAEIEQLQHGDEPGRAASVRSEHDWLIAELATITGLGGRARRFPDGDERARIAAGKAIRRALSRIADTDEVVGEHLRASVYTGNRCSYYPA